MRLKDFVVAACSSVYMTVMATKQVRPVFVETADEIVVITVYTYYF